jgi:ankyrin repeat protein
LTRSDDPAPPAKTSGVGVACRVVAAVVLIVVLPFVLVGMSTGLLHMPGRGRPGDQVPALAAATQAIAEGDAAGLSRLLDGQAARLRPHFGPLLVAAARAGDVEAVGLLLAAGAAPDWTTPGGTTALYAAGRGGHTEAMQCLLEAGANPIGLDRGGLLLSAAAGEGRGDAIAVLIEAGADPDAAGPDGRPALYAAARAPDGGAVEALLAGGADPNGCGAGVVSPLTEAAAAGNAAAVEALLRAGARLGGAPGESPSELHLAAASGRTRGAELLLSAGADPNGADGSGETALGVAARRGDVDMVRFLVGAGADPDGHGPGTVPPLLAAASGWGWHERAAASSDCVQALLDAGADWAAAGPDGMTCFHCAARRGKVQILNRLVDLGADVNRPVMEGETAVTALGLAASARRWEAVEALLARGAVPAEAEGARVLVIAAGAGRTGVVQEMLRLGADVNRPVMEGETTVTALGLAASARRWEAVEALLAWGAVPGEADGASVLGPAVRAGRTGIVREMLRFGVDVNSPDEEGRLPLARAEDPALVRLLLEHGADPRMRTLWQEPALVAAAGLPDPEVARLLLEATEEPDAAMLGEALSVASRWGRRETVSLFLGAGADPNYRAARGATPLHAAAGHGHVDILQLLMERGAERDGRDAEGATPLHVAAASGHRGAVELLLASGADVNARNDQGVSATEAAAANGQEETVELLVGAGADRAARRAAARLARERKRQAAGPPPGLRRRLLPFGD